MIVWTYLRWTQERFQDSAQNGLQSCADHVEWEPVRNAVLVEFAEARVNFEGLFHYCEAVVEWDV